MRKMSFFQQLYWCYFSKPHSDRKIYRAAVQYEFGKVVELGISSVERTCRLLELSQRFAEQPIQYTGIDLFESEVRGTSRIGYKFAHVELKKTGSKVKLMPADPFSFLSRSANLVSGVDLLIIGKNVDQESMSRSWFYIPRMLHQESLVLIERQNGNESEIEETDYQAMLERAEKMVNQQSEFNFRRAA